MTVSELLIEDDRLLGVLAADARVERLGGDATWSEGPAYLPGEDAVIWSDIPGDRILRWDAGTGRISVQATGVEFTNGRTLDRQGRVVTCSHGRRAIERTEPDGSTHVLAGRWNGVRFNSPNDVVVARDGTIWFTDPAYGIIQPHEGHPGEREYDDHWVFRFDPASGQVDPVVLDVEEPNGLAFSPAEDLLYVSDTSGAFGRDSRRGHHIRVYEVFGGRRVKNGRVFAAVGPGLADGLRVDVAGNVWTSAGDGVHIYAPDGQRLGIVPVPETVANLCFGGPDGTTLFIAATTSLYRITTRTRGATFSPGAEAPGGGRDGLAPGGSPPR
jgi:gluconolactonase